MVRKGVKGGQEKVENGRAWAYLRVSTDEQDVNNQRLEILKVAQDHNLGAVKFVEEIVSGRKSWRDRSLAGIIDGMKEGDALLVAELSRLGRSMLEVMEILSIATQRGLRVYAAKGGWSLDGSVQSKVMAMVLAMVAEVERDLISQRTKAALATKKAAGVRLGRRPGPGRSKLDDHAEQIREFLQLGLAKTKIAKKFDTTPANLRHWLRQRTGESSKQEE
jgi:DNA invertase Pin-like site-specific DNA recombinase